MSKLNLPYGLNIASSDPFDSRLICANEASRFALVDSGLAYMGMVVFQLDSKQFFKLTGNSNQDWQHFEITLSDSVATDSSTVAASAKAVKKSFDEALKKEPKISKNSGFNLPKSSDEKIYDTGKLATIAAVNKVHQYLKQLESRINALEQSL
ncbi:hypothetical protein [Persicobacter diffluens]|uniref:Uncharacterized protein n=1 Tax=Persicobacter diffluens TaxID=981 RepID=A0AAN4W601_9BACT|nr:hypothetical protein PEDI_55190 [Persicobacter diffluens]